MCGYVFDIKRFAIHDGPGIRTTVFFQGCPLRCWWCHNPESIAMPVEGIINSNERKVQKFKTEELMQELRKDITFFDESGGGVTFSGGEPFVQYRFLFNVLQKCKEEFIHTAIDTSGWVQTDIFKESLDLSDVFLMDIKLTEKESHMKYTGVDNKRILENLTLLLDRKKTTYIRIPLIPGVNDKKEQIESVISLIQGRDNVKRIDILPFHKIASHKYDKLNMDYKMQKVDEPDKLEVFKVRDQFLDAGFSVNIGG
ncbi:MAG: glycyl-radical enzyme activating protein [Bacteroidales bacterium]|nr:glycyl-radical enzyme activating protein [Bacteroidales bacterium]